MNPNTSTHEILHKAPSFLECTWGGGKCWGKKGRLTTKLISPLTEFMKQKRKQTARVIKVLVISLQRKGITAHTKWKGILAERCL